MIKEHRVWIDLSDIAVWSGHHTGIQRVVYQLSKHFAADPGMDVGYFTFDKREKCFRESSFDSIEQQVEASRSQTSGGQLRHASRQATLKAFAYHVYAKSPTWLKNKLTTPQNKARIRRAYHRARSMHRPLLKPVVPSAHTQVTFGDEDIILVMGKPWDYAPDFMETMRRAKQEHPFKLVQVVYDLIPVFFPHLFGAPLFAPYTQHMFEVAALSDGLLAISKSSKRDMERFCKEMHLPQPPIEVIRLGDDFSEAKSVKPDIPSLKNGNFLLCVGTIEVRKNHQLLYAAYKEGLSRGIKLPKLVIVGGTGWYTNDVLYQFTHDPELADLVYIRQGIGDGQLKWLYQNCRLTVYPSVYEGWGLPIAESLMYGKLCLSSNTSSMTEIAGDLIDYFSPYDSGQCIEVICRYLDNATLAQKEDDIKEKYKPHMWDKTYKQVREFVNGPKDMGSNA